MDSMDTVPTTGKLTILKLPVNDILPRIPEWMISSETHLIFQEGVLLFQTENWEECDQGGWSRAGERG